LTTDVASLMNHPEGKLMANDNPHGRMEAGKQTQRILFI